MTTPDLLPPPRRIGLPPKFHTWRPGQPSSILRIIDSPRRFPTLVQPVGSGKSITYASMIRLAGGKWVILTGTKSLQDQLQADFTSLDWVDVRGQSNYPCAIDPTDTADMGVCHAGVDCVLRRGGCKAFDVVREAHHASVTITNYSWWLSHNKYGEGFPAIDGLVMDEAHDAPDALAEFLSCEILRSHVPQYLQGDPPPPTQWRLWAHSRALALETDMEQRKTRARQEKSARRSLRAAKNLLMVLQRLSQVRSESDWVMEEGKRGWRFDPISPAQFAEEYLFRQTPKVVLVSATIREKTLSLLGLTPEDYDFAESPSTFPVARRPVIHFTGQPRVALTFRSTDSDLRLWVTRIDNIINRRLDRKGIIHCVSYARRDFLYRNSRHRDLFITHNSGEQAQAVARFKAAKPPAIFISPSATTGLDFPHAECRYQIIAKVPFPDQRSKILKARARIDPEYPMYLTMLDVVQATGRGMRAEDDWCETIIVDDNWSWFKGKFARYAPAWFLESCKRTESIPDAINF